MGPEEQGHSYIGRWRSMHARAPGPRPFGDEISYERAAVFLSDCARVEDWGAGLGWFAVAMRRHSRAVVVGIDGSGSPGVSIIADLREYRSRVEGILLRHVLEHNREWRSILSNALASFSKKLVVVIHTPFSESTVNLGNHVFADGGAVPILSLPRSEVLETIRREKGLAWVEERLASATDFGQETLFLIERAPPGAEPASTTPPAPPPAASPPGPDGT